MAHLRHFLESGCVKVRTMGSEPEGGCAPARPLTLHIAVPCDAGNAKETGRDQRYRSRQMHRMRNLLQVVQPRRLPPRHRPAQGFALHGGVPGRYRHFALQCPRTAGKLEEAAKKLRQTNPFPGITGRICFHPCEKECARNAVDGAVNINAVEQFLGDVQISLSGTVEPSHICDWNVAPGLVPPDRPHARAEDAPTHPDTAWRSDRCAERW